MKSNAKEEDIPVTKALMVLEDLADAIWADKNYTIDDIESNSLSEVLLERFSRFLGGAGFSAEKRVDSSSSSE
jgi:hypothetical protein